MGDKEESSEGAQRLGHHQAASAQLLCFALELTVKPRGAPGVLEHIEIDTAHFKGNFPESCEIHALLGDTTSTWTTANGQDKDWTLILPRTKLGSHRQHYFQLENTEGNIYTHVKVTIYPDGGLQRIRILGRRNANDNENIVEDVVHLGSTSAVGESVLAVSPTKHVIPVLPLTPEAFAPFGRVIQAYDDATVAPKGAKTSSANAGSATKFHKLSLVESSYPKDAGATAGISVYRCQPVAVSDSGFLLLDVLERHPFTNQAFIPMGQSSGSGTASTYIVAVAKTDIDDHPDLSSLRAFLATGAQGVVYNTAVWRECRYSRDVFTDLTSTPLLQDQPMTVLKVRFYHGVVT